MQLQQPLVRDRFQLPPRIMFGPRPGWRLYSSAPCQTAKAGGCPGKSGRGGRTLGRHFRATLGLPRTAHPSKPCDQTVGVYNGACVRNQAHVVQFNCTGMGNGQMDRHSDAAIAFLLYMVDAAPIPQLREPIGPIVRPHGIARGLHRLVQPRGRQSIGRSRACAK